MDPQLSSVPDLEGVVAPATGNSQEASSGTTTTTTTTAVAAAAATSSPSGENLAGLPKEDEGTTTNPTPARDSTTEAEGEDVVDEKVAQPATKPICEDPRFAQYFKMLKMGVPDPAIRMKMSSEGIDPSLLE